VTKATTQEQDLLFQSYYTFSLLCELQNNCLLESDYFEEMKFDQPLIKEELRKTGIWNQGCLLIGLYAFLVVPRQLIAQDYASEYSEIDSFLDQYTQNTKTGYKDDSQSIKYLRHIRNAVAHAHVEFRPGDVVIFKDEDIKTQESFSTELPLRYLGILLKKLQDVHVLYGQDFYN